MKIRIMIILTVLTIVFQACTSDKKVDQDKGPIIMPINPNGDSELALMMRDMFEDGLKIKEKIKNGEVPELIMEFEKIHTVEATEPEKQASTEYKLHGTSYLRAIDALKKAHKDDLEKSYTDMVDACMNCHRALCPGPMVRIKKLYL